MVFRPSHPIILPTNDINIDLERRNKAAYGWTMVTSVAHVWFNTFFEGQGPENNGNAASDGVFEITWDAMDGIKGSARKGTKALDKLAVVWRAVDGAKGVPKLTQIITEPREGEPVPETKAADWKSAQHSNLTAIGKDLGLRTASPASVRSSGSSPPSKEEDQLAGVKTHGPNGEENVMHNSGAASGGEGQSAIAVSKPDLGMSKVASPLSTADAGEPSKIVGVDLGSAVGIVKSNSES